jgi:hypothetical protein
MDSKLLNSYFLLIILLLVASEFLDLYNKNIKIRKPYHSSILYWAHYIVNSLSIFMRNLAYLRSLFFIKILIIYKKNFYDKFIIISGLEI